MTKKYTRILSIDGGGIRAIIPGRILILLENKLIERSGRPETRLVDYFDLIAGSGSGGILACAYLSPVKPHNSTPRFNAKQVVELFSKFGNRIFNNTLDQRILTFNGLLNEKYDDDDFEKVLHDYFEDLHLSHLLKPCLIPAYDISRRKAHFFTQHTAHASSADFFVREVARATSAAPTYFECKLVQSFSGVSYPLIDGGIFANNPALSAFVEASKIFRENQVTTENTVILSLGTGIVHKQYAFEDAKDWGLPNWSRPLFDMTTSALSESVDHQLRTLFSAQPTNQYLRINPTLPHDISNEIDDASTENLRALNELGQYTAEELEYQLDELVTLLLEGQSI